MNHWKILYFHNTGKPLYGHRLNKDNSLWTVCFVPGKENVYANVEKTARNITLWRNSNSFNNDKFLTQQDECDMNTHLTRKRKTCLCNIRTIVTPCDLYRRLCLLALHFSKFNRQPVNWTLSMTLSVVFV